MVKAGQVRHDRAKTRYEPAGGPYNFGNNDALKQDTSGSNVAQIESVEALLLTPGDRSPLT